MGEKQAWLNLLKMGPKKAGGGKKKEGGAAAAASTSSTKAAPAEKKTEEKKPKSKAPPSKEKSTAPPAKKDKKDAPKPKQAPVKKTRPDPKEKKDVKTQEREKHSAKAVVTKALKTQKKVLKRASGIRTRKIRTSVQSRRPRTLKLPRDPKYPRKSHPKRNRLDAYNIIKHPLTTESAMKKIEDNNTLVFVVNIKANKHHIRQAVKKMYDVDSQSQHLNKARWQEEVVREVEARP